MTAPTPSDSTLPRRRNPQPEPGTVTPAHTLQWLAAGWRTFLADPGVWLIQTTLFILILAALGLVPFLGWAVAPLALPVLMGGMLTAVDARERGRRPQITQLFDGLRLHAGNLLMIGAFHLLGALLAALIAAAVGSSAVFTGMLVGAAEGVGLATGGIMLAVVIFTALWVLLMMALWFAPALVMLQDAAPLDAMRLSARACLRNLLTFGVFGMMLYVLTWLAMLPAGLGVLVLLPVLMGALHASWRDTFGRHPALIAPPPPQQP